MLPQAFHYFRTVVLNFGSSNLGRKMYTGPIHAYCIHISTEALKIIHGIQRLVNLKVRAPTSWYRSVMANL